MPADIQARIRRKEEGASPTRKKVKSAPVVDDDEVTEVPAPAGPRTPEKPWADKGKGKGKKGKGRKRRAEHDDGDDEVATKTGKRTRRKTGAR